MLEIAPGIRVPDHEFEISAIRSQGPGGQNVNKVSTAILVRFDVARSSLPARYRDGLLAMRDRRISRDGVVSIKAQRYRSQERNREDALERLRQLIVQAGSRAKPRLATRPSAASRRRRQEDKKRRATTKTLRRPPRDTD